MRWSVFVGPDFIVIEEINITDESSDANFYANPRLVTHIDDHAIQALTQFYREHLADG